MIEADHEIIAARGQTRRRVWLVPAAHGQPLPPGIVTQHAYNPAAERQRAAALGRQPRLERAQPPEQVGRGGILDDQFVQGIDAKIGAAAARIPDGSAIQKSDSRRVGEHRKQRGRIASIDLLHPKTASFRRSAERCHQRQPWPAAVGIGTVRGDNPHVG